MAAAGSFLTQPTTSPMTHEANSPVTTKMLNLSSNTSSSSTASSVLIRSTDPPPAHRLGLALPDSSSSDKQASFSSSSSSASFSSVGSQRVRIKAKYLREVKSPFAEERNGGQPQGRDDPVPPALPGNLPPGYQQQRETADAVAQKRGEHQQTLGSAGRPAPVVDTFNRGSSNGGDGRDDDRATRKSVTDEGVYLNAKASSVAFSLKQGAPTSSQQLHSQPPGPSNHVKITQYAAGGKHKVFKEQLLKRQESSGPVKRYVRPTLVDSNHGVSHTDGQRPERGNEDGINNPNTVAAVTAAAVAATVPIVKAQSDLEGKMDAMLAKLAHLHEMSDRAHQSQAEQQQQPQEVAATSQVSDKAVELQRQLDGAIDKRLQQLEKMQEMQMEWQDKLMANQHPAQRPEKPPPLTQQHPLPHGVRSGISDQPHPERESTRRTQMPAETVLRPPVGPEEERNYGPISHQAFSQQAVQHWDTKPTRDHSEPRGAENPHQSDRVKAQKKNRYTPAFTLHRFPPQHVPSTKRRKGTVSSDNGLEMESERWAKQPSPLDTPAPRQRAPLPVTQNPPPKLTHAGRGLLEEILTSHDEEERNRAKRGQQTHSPQVTAVARGVTSPESGTELKAANLVQQLSKLKTEMKEMKTDLIKNLHSDGRVGQSHPHSPTRTSRSELHEEAEREWDELMQRRLQPAPVDIYLRKPPTLPDASLPVPLPRQPLSPSHYNAPFHPSLCADAKAVLDKVQSSKLCLEANLAAVVRAKEQEEFYNYLDSLHLRGEAAEKAQLRYRVGQMIAALDEEIKREASKSRLPRPSPHIPESDNKGTGPGQGPAASTRLVKAGGRRKAVAARIDSGLGKGQQPAPAVGEKAGGTGKRDKENVARTKKQPPNRARKPLPVDHNQDEAYLTRVYGKALYQASRSTLKKEPYLKYATSSPRPKPARVPSAAQVKGTEMKSAKVQTESSLRTIPIPRPTNRFFFDPYPVASSSVRQPRPESGPGSVLPTPPPVHPQPAPPTGPSHGQLIPMAVALGPPQVGGLTRPVTIQTDGLEEGVVRDLEKREARTNVAVVNIHSKGKRPKLTVQHLPAVDIDTELSSQASSVAEYDGAPEGATPIAGRAEIHPPDEDKLPGQTQFSHYLAVTEEAEPEKESEDELPTPGISLPGHYTETRGPYHGPAFPPRAPHPGPSYRGPASEQLAGDIRKDILENAAMEWIEQELIARMISELYSQRAVREPRPASPESSIASSANDSIVETIGPAGLQLFVDAGQAVDPTLVSALVREVLEEKVTTAVGQHDRDVPGRQPTMPTPPVLPEADSKPPIPTPEVTPTASPAHTPPLVASRVATPPASPSGASPVESETESVKELTPTRIAAARDEPIAAPPTYVRTPVNTPPPSPPPDIPTPEGSPRESPKLISAADGFVVTPVGTPELASPEPEVEESLILLPSPEPVVAEEEPVPPTPSPSLPTPSSPTPTPSSDTTTQPTPSTETAGHTISEGEWLISVKSEGQVEDSTEDEPGVVAMREVSNSSSIDSTLMGAEDIEKDMQEYQLSEGEISPVKRTPKLYSQDPVVAILAHLRQRPDPSAGPTGIPLYPTASQTLNNNDTKSLGEVSLGQRPALTPSSERLLFQEAYGAEPPEVTPGSGVAKRSPGEFGGEEAEGWAGRQTTEDSTMRISQLDGTKHEQPTREKEPDTAGQRSAVTRPLSAQRIIQVVGKASSPEPARRHTPEDLGETLSGQESDNISEGSIEGEDNGDDEGGVDQPGERERIPSRVPIPSNLFGTQTVSDLDTRTLTPDALNLEALLQSGYLSQTFSQSEGGTSDFEFARPPPVAAGGSSGIQRPPNAGPRPVGADSLRVPENPRKDEGGSKPGVGMSFSVRLPSASESAGLDLSQTISEGEIPAADTTSDVSELSGGPIV